MFTAENSLKSAKTWKQPKCPEVDKQNMVCTYWAVFSLKEEGNPDICYNVGKF